jgi:hypothetical protein
MEFSSFKDHHNEEQHRDREIPFVQFLENARPVFETHVLERLDPTDRALFSRASRKCRDAVIISSLPLAGSMALPFKVEDLIQSVGLLRWARANDCPVLDARTFALAAGSDSGSMHVLGYLTEQDCPWWGRAQCSRIGSSLGRHPPPHVSLTTITVSLTVSRSPPEELCAIRL